MQPGRRVGPYQILEILGQGGVVAFCIAFNANPTLVGRMVTIDDWQVLLAGILPQTFHPQMPAAGAFSQLPHGEVEAHL